MVALGEEATMSPTIVPQSCAALTYIWGLADNGTISRRDAYLSTKRCNTILRDRKLVAQFGFTINIGNLSQDQFVDAYADLPLMQHELAAIFYALTR